MDMRALVRLGKFLSDKADWCVRLQDMGMDNTVNLYIEVDASWGGSSRWLDGRATTGYRICVNDFQVEHSSFTQPGLAALSSGEAELRALSRAGAEVLWAKSVLGEMGVTCSSIRVMTDASAAWSNACRLGPGRMRHLGIGECFIKEAAHHKLFTLCKVPGKQNAADVLTKHVDRETRLRHCAKTGFSNEYKRSEFKEVEVERINDIEQSGTEQLQRQTA
eukprot:981957-Amphidinium_carterae.2